MVRFSKYVTMLIYSQTLSLNFGSFNNILGLYKQKEKAQNFFYITKILKDM